VDVLLSKDAVQASKYNATFIPIQQILNNKVKLILMIIQSKLGISEIFNQNDKLENISFIT
jgi:hypothetical protein